MTNRWNDALQSRYDQLVELSLLKAKERDLFEHLHDIEGYDERLISDLWAAEWGETRWLV